MNCKYTPKKFMKSDSHYDKQKVNCAVIFIEYLSHTKSKWTGKTFELIDWQETIIRDFFRYDKF